MNIQAISRAALCQILETFVSFASSYFFFSLNKLEACSYRYATAKVDEDDTVDADVDEDDMSTLQLLSYSNGHIYIFFLLGCSSFRLTGWLYTRGITKMLADKKCDNKCK